MFKNGTWSEKHARNSDKQEKESNAKPLAYTLATRWRKTQCYRLSNTSCTFHINCWWLESNKEPVCSSHNSLAPFHLSCEAVISRPLLLKVERWLADQMINVENNFFTRIQLNWKGGQLAFGMNKVSQYVFCEIETLQKKTVPKQKKVVDT